MAQWSQRWLADLEVVYLWVDGIYIKAGLEKDRAAVLVVLAALSYGRKVVLAVVPGHRESSQSWSSVLRDLKSRSLACPRLVAGDGHLGIWGALGSVYPEAEQQRCWNHKMLNVLDKLPKRLYTAAKPLLSRIVYAPGQKPTEAAKREFQLWCRKHAQEPAAECLERDWDRLITFYRFPQAHWRHLRTTNPIESALRLRTDAARRYKRVDNATAVMWKLLLLAEKRFRRLNAPGQLREVFLGAQYVDGVRVQNRSEEGGRRLIFFHTS